MPWSLRQKTTAKVVACTRQAFEEAGLMLLRALRIPTRKSDDAQSDTLRTKTEVPQIQPIELHEKWLDVLDDYIACVSHEMNRPLGAILGKAELGMTLIDSNKANARELRWLAAEIRTEADRATVLLDSMYLVLRKETVAIDAANRKDLLNVRTPEKKKGGTWPPSS